MVKSLIKECNLEPLLLGVVFRVFHLIHQKKNSLQKSYYKFQRYNLVFLQSLKFDLGFYHQTCFLTLHIV